MKITWGNFHVFIWFSQIRIKKRKFLCRFSGDFPSFLCFFNNQKNCWALEFPKLKFNWIKFDFEILNETKTKKEKVVKKIIFFIFRLLETKRKIPLCENVNGFVRILNENCYLDIWSFHTKILFHLISV